MPIFLNLSLKTKEVSLNLHYIISSELLLSSFGLRKLINWVIKYSTFEGGFLRFHGQKGIPIRKWRAGFRRGFVNFKDRIFKFGTEVNFLKKINLINMSGLIWGWNRGWKPQKKPFFEQLYTILLLINSPIIGFSS